MKEINKTQWESNGDSISSCAHQ